MGLKGPGASVLRLWSTGIAGEVSGFGLVKNQRSAKQPKTS